MPEDGTTIRVQIEANVAMTIVKHAYDQYPVASCGQLLGLEDENSGMVSVSHAFEYPASAMENNGAGIRNKTTQRYKSDMITQLKEVNVDSNPVGLYLNSPLGRFFNQAMVQNMLAAQLDNPEAILLVYDVESAVKGDDRFPLRAYRLSPEFLRVKKEQNEAQLAATGSANSAAVVAFTSEQLTKHGLSYENVFEELTISVHNSHLVNLYLHTMKGAGTAAQRDYDSLNVGVDPYLEKNMEAIFESMEEFHYDQSNYNYYQRHNAREKLKIQQWQQRRKAENATREAQGKPALPLNEWKSLFKLPDEPSRLENLLISGQMNQYCSQIEEFGASLLSKLSPSQKVLEQEL